MEQTLGTLAVPTRYSSTDHVPKVPSFFLLYVSPWLMVPRAHFFLSFLVLWNVNVMTFPPNSRSASLVFLFRNNLFLFFFFFKKKGTFNNSTQGTSLPYLTSLQDKENMNGILPNLCLSVCLSGPRRSERAIHTFFLRKSLFFFLFKSRHSFRYLKDRGTVEHEVREEKSVCHHLDHKKVSGRSFLWSE